MREIVENMRQSKNNLRRQNWTVCRLVINILILLIISLQGTCSWILWQNSIFENQPCQVFTIDERLKKTFFTYSLKNNDFQNCLQQTRYCHSFGDLVSAVKVHTLCNKPGWFVRIPVPFHKVAQTPWNSSIYVTLATWKLRDRFNSKIKPTSECKLLFLPMIHGRISISICLVWRKNSNTDRCHDGSLKLYENINQPVKGRVL